MTTLTGNVLDCDQSNY